MHGVVCRALRCAGLIVVLAGSLVGPAFARPAASPAGDVDAARFAELRERLARQEERLCELERQGAAADAQEIDGQRVAALREQVRAVLAEPGFRESLGATALQAGYEKGYFIRSSDERFLLRAQGVLQFRYEYYNTHSRNRYLAAGTERDDRSGFDLSRVRLILSGHAHSPDLTYYVQVRADSTQRYDAGVLDAYVNYRFADAFQVRMGIFKAAATTVSLTSDSELQTVDRPLVDAVYGLDRGLGLRFWGHWQDKRFEWYFDALNSLRTVRGRTITPDPSELDANPAIVARLVWNALGSGADLAGEPDLAHLAEPTLSLALHYAFNEDDGDPTGLRIPAPLLIRSRGAGAFGMVSSRGLQINQLGLASAFKWQGFSARGEYILRLIDVRDPAAPWLAQTGDDSTTAQHGAYVQAGYFLPIPEFQRKVEVVGRVGVVSALAEEVDCALEYTFGLNYYINGHKVKLQTEVTHVTEAPISSASAGVATVNDQAWFWRMQVQLAF